MNQLSFIWVLFIALLLFAMLIYWDFSGRPKRGRWMRWAAILVAVTSLVLLYVLPSISKIAIGQRVAISSDNADESALDSLGALGVTVLASFDEYLDYSLSHSIDELVVVGDGLNSWELSQVAHPMSHVVSTMKQEGPSSYYPNQASEQSFTQLKFGLIVHSDLHVSLSGPGLAEQTKLVKRNQHYVAFDIVPNLSGNLTYDLIGIREKDTVFAEVVPMNILPVKQRNVLLLSGAPSFESRYLTNHLAAAGYGIAERHKVSIETYHTSFTNLKEHSLNRLTQKVLEKYNTVFVDAVAYEGMYASDRRTLLDRVSTGELGLVWLGSPTRSGPISLQSGPTTTLIFRGKDGELELKTTGWTADNSVQVSLQEQSIGRLKSLGLGSVVYPTLANMYTLVLRGEKALYAQLWQTLLDPVIGKAWTLPLAELSAFPRTNEPTTFSIRTSNLEAFNLDSVRVPLSEQWYLKNQWEGTYWPNMRGWHTINLDQGGQQYFVFNDGEWPVQQAIEKQEQMVSYNSKESESLQETTRSVPISPWYFFGAFVVAMGYLWVEQRVG